MPDTGPRFKNPNLQALWNMRWPAVYICGPVLGLVMVNLFFGLPGHLWWLAGGFFSFSVVLFFILVRGEVRRLRQITHGR